MTITFATADNISKASCIYSNLPSKYIHIYTLISTYFHNKHFKQTFNRIGKNLSTEKYDRNPDIKENDEHITHQT